MQLPDPFQVQQPSSPIDDVISQESTDRISPRAVRCPFCGSAQFFGRRKVSIIGWVLYGSAIANIVISGFLIFFFIGLCTIFLTPVLALCAYVWGFEHANTCAQCKQDF